jgi:hypothetical protein
MIPINCTVCSASDEMKRLRKCPICFKYVCEECGFFFAGRYFCSKGCADEFFWGGSDEDEE